MWIVNKKELRYVGSIAFAPFTVAALPASFSMTVDVRFEYENLFWQLDFIHHSYGVIPIGPPYY